MSTPARAALSGERWGNSLPYNYYHFIDAINTNFSAHRKREAVIAVYHLLQESHLPPLHQLRAVLLLCYLSGNLKEKQVHFVHAEQLYLAARLPLPVHKSLLPVASNPMLDDIHFMLHKLRGDLGEKSELCVEGPFGGGHPGHILDWHLYCYACVEETLAKFYHQQSGCFDWIDQVEIEPIEKEWMIKQHEMSTAVKTAAQVSLQREQSAAAAELAKEPKIAIATYAEVASRSTVPAKRKIVRDAFLDLSSEPDDRHLRWKVSRIFPDSGRGRYRYYWGRPQEQPRLAHSHEHFDHDMPQW